MIKKMDQADELSFENWAHEIPQSVTFNWSKSELLHSFHNDLCYGYFESGVLQSAVCFSSLRDPLEVLWLATRPRVLGQGFMKKLLLELINNAYSQIAPQAQNMILEVHENNLKAIELYKNLGFAEFRRRPRYYRDGAAALMMTLKLKA